MQSLSQTTIFALPPPFSQGLIFFRLQHKGLCFFGFHFFEKPNEHVVLQKKRIVLKDFQLQPYKDIVCHSQIFGLRLNS